MDAPPCDVVGCLDRCHWVSVAPPTEHFEEFLCETHMAVLKQSHPGIAGGYREWSTSLAELSRSPSLRRSKVARSMQPSIRRAEPKSRDASEAALPSLT